MLGRRIMGERFRKGGVRSANESEPGERTVSRLHREV